MSIGTPRQVRAAMGAAALVIGLGVATPAWAHVSMEAKNTRPGATSEYTISVPNESDTADTTLVEVQLPDAFEVVDTKPGKGWTMAVESGVLVLQGGTIRPGERRDFRFTAVNPGRRGTVVFPAIQTYSDGEEVRWVGEEDSDRPAARVTITGKPVAQPAAPASEPATEPAPEPTEAAEPSEAPTAAASEAPEPAEEAATDWTLPVLLVAAAVVAAFVAAARQRRR